MADKHAPPDKPERNFDRRRHLWIMQLVKDSRLTPTAFRVGILLSEQYMNRKKGGLAWPSVATLCADLDVCERAMQDAIKLLVDREHLTRENRVGKTPFYAMRENTKTLSEKTKENQGIKGINPRRNLHPQTPADLCASPPQICSKDPRSSVPEPPHKSAPKPIEEPSYRTSLIEPKRSASPHADAHERENLGSEFLIERNSPSGKIAEAEPSQGAFRKAETESGGKPTQVPRSGKITKRPREPVQGDLIPAPKAAHPSDASLPAELIEPFGEFYEIFPFARDRGAARDAFRWAAVIARAKPSELIEGARRYADERAQDRRDPATVRQFTRTPAKWLRAEGWTNASAPTSAPRANGFDHAAAAKRSLAESAAIALAMFPEPQGDDFTHGQILDLKAEQ